MKFTMKKRHTVLALLVLFLGLAVLANWYYANPGNNVLPADGTSDIDSSNVNGSNLGDAIYVNTTDVYDEYFAGAKLSRDESYDEAVATLKEIIDSGELGKVVDIQHNENIGYYHFAHSYVRGNWRNTKIAAPISVAKTCHDFDILLYLLGNDIHYEYISSMGSLTYFTNKNSQ